jgi:acetylornithine deacetylase/succinyl-diaminopimelate desuccinylase-like protein
MKILVWLLACVIVAAPVSAQSGLTPFDKLGRDILRELVETNTTYRAGSTSRAARLLEARFRAAGFPAADVQVVGPTTGPDAKDANLVVRYHGSGRRRPVLLIGHLDVVEARRADWVLDPFKLTERDGYFYGRGTLDMKCGDAAWVAALLRMKREGVVPAGDFILALTAGEEEGGGYNGIVWLQAHRPELIAAQYVVNADGGGGELHDGKPVSLDVDAAEKVFHTLYLTARNPGGHSSLPTKDNAIYQLSAALGRVAAYDFPLRTNAVTRAYFAATGKLLSGPAAEEMRAIGASDSPDSATLARLAARSPLYNSTLRTTCVATMIEGGHAVNALPQRARATVNCRILPGEDPVAVERTIRAVVADTGVVVTSADSAKASPPSPLPPELERVLRTVTTSMWGPIPIVPDMATGASDALYFRSAGVPAYNISGLFADPANPADMRAHGLDERIGVKAFYDQLEFTYRLLKAL